MRKPNPQALEPGDRIDVRALDVTEPDSIESCVTSVLKDYGRIDVLINNAGIHLMGAVEDMDQASLRRVFETNLFGAINLARAVLPGMREQRRGRIICVSSIGAQIGRVMDGAYCGSKAALEMVFEAMRYEVGRFGIEVSMVCPGAFKTGIGEKLAMPTTSLDKQSPYRSLLGFRWQKVREAVAIGGDPQDVAQLIMQIADDPSPKYRYVVGEKAVQIQHTLNSLDDEGRKAMIRNLAGIDWWLSGEAGPSDGAGERHSR
jgi:NAD(P)-dependent dehydrogenase (short-subunit alcohol dehydrogenase family)